jgi:hypothetical protein
LGGVGVEGAAKKAHFLVTGSTIAWQVYCCMHSEASGICACSLSGHCTDASQFYVLQCLEWVQQYLHHELPYAASAVTRASTCQITSPRPRQLPHHERGTCPLRPQNPSQTCRLCQLSLYFEACVPIKLHNFHKLS